MILLYENLVNGDMYPDDSVVVSVVANESSSTLLAISPPSNEVVTKIDKCLSFTLSSSRNKIQPLTVSL